MVGKRITEPVLPNKLLIQMTHCSNISSRSMNPSFFKVRTFVCIKQPLDTHMIVAFLLGKNILLLKIACIYIPIKNSHVYLSHS